MKKTPVSITITGTQYFSSEEEQLLFALESLLPEADEADESLFSAAREGRQARSVELCTAGEMRFGRESVEISYDESEITGLPGCRTTFHVANNGLVTLTRAGRTKTHLVFENGKRHMLASSGENAPSVCVSCRKVQQHLSAASGGEISIDYAVEVGGQLAEHNAYTIRVRV